MKRRKYKAIHFDMDGVIADTEEFHVAAEQKTCFDHGFKINVDEWSGFKGRTAIDIFTYLIENYGDSSIHKPQDLINYKTNAFIESLRGKLQPIDGVIDFLNWARDNYENVSLVTSSNKNVQEFIIGSFGVSNIFDTIVTGDDITKGKPDPGSYLLAIKRLGLSPENCLVIEDSKSGIASALAAGCDVLAITTSHSASELLSAKPTYIVDSYKEAISILTE